MIENNFNYSGHWWLPEEPNNIVSGSLIYDEETGVILDLIGAFSELFKNKKHQKVDIILGVANGKNSLF